MNKKADITTLSKEELIDEVMQLKHQVSLLQKMVFGPRTDRFKLPVEVAANQLALGVSVEPLAEVKVSKTTVKEHDRSKVKLEAKKHPGRNPLPSNLRREEIIIEPTEDVTGCTRLEDEVTEVLEVKAAEFYVKRYIRHKYVRKQDEGIAIGKLPNRVIEKGIPGASVLTMLIIGKFIDHLPIYRQIAIFKRAGINLHYNTVLDWTNQGLDVLVPLYELLKRKILASIYMKRWKELTVFTTDGRLEIDNNKIENEIRPIALGRKNYLFAGSHESAQRIAMIYSLLASCKANDLNPAAWLTHLLEELPNRTVNNIEDLLPTKG